MYRTLRVTSRLSVFVRFNLSNYLFGLSTGWSEFDAWLDIGLGPVHFGVEYLRD
jgi:hypothetical protein